MNLTLNQYLNSTYIHISEISEKEYFEIEKKFADQNFPFNTSGIRNDGLSSYYYFRLNCHDDKIESVFNSIKLYLFKVYSEKFFNSFFINQDKIENLKSRLIGSENRHKSLLKRAKIFKAESEINSAKYLKLNLIENNYNQELNSLRENLNALEEDKKKNTHRLNLEKDRNKSFLNSYESLKKEIQNSINTEKDYKLYEIELNESKNNNIDLKKHLKVARSSTTKLRNRLEKLNTDSISKSENDKYDEIIMNLTFEKNELKKMSENENRFIKKQYKKQLSIEIEQLEKRFELFKNDEKERQKIEVEKEWEDYIEDADTENTKYKAENFKLKTERENYKDQFEHYKQVVDEQKLEEYWKESQTYSQLNQTPFFKNLQFLKPSDEIVLKEMDNPDFLIKHLLLLNSDRKNVKGKSVITSNNWSEYLFNPNDNKGQKFKINSKNTTKPLGRMYYKFEDDITKVMISSKSYQKKDFAKLKRL